MEYELLTDRKASTGDQRGIRDWNVHRLRWEVVWGLLLPGRGYGSMKKFKVNTGKT